jgi:hypothetical protein
VASAGRDSQNIRSSSSAYFVTDWLSECAVAASCSGPHSTRGQCCADGAGSLATWSMAHVKASCLLFRSCDHSSRVIHVISVLSPLQGCWQAHLAAYLQRFRCCSM